MNKNEFINKIRPIIDNENKKRSYPLYNSVVISQACLETGFGKSEIMMKSNAIFGIKATSSWKGAVYNANTKEYFSYNPSNITACFRAYENIEQSVYDYFNLICKNSRYKDALFSTSPYNCICAIKQGGYATDPIYVDSIMKIIKDYNLTCYDKFEIEQSINLENNGIYIVKAGDNLSKIAKKFNTTYQKIAKDNKIENPDLIYPGQQLIINKVENSNNSTIYIVKAGDNLSKIAKKFNTTYQKIAKDNKIENPNLIYPGQQLIIK